MIIILVDNSACSYLNVNTNINTCSPIIKDTSKKTNNNCYTNNDPCF